MLILVVSLIFGLSVVLCVLSILRIRSAQGYEAAARAFYEQANQASDKAIELYEKIKKEFPADNKRISEAVEFLSGVCRDVCAVNNLYKDLYLVVCSRPLEGFSDPEVQSILRVIIQKEREMLNKYPQYIDEERVAKLMPLIE